MSNDLIVGLLCGMLIGPGVWVALYAVGIRLWSFLAGFFSKLPGVGAYRQYLSVADVETKRSILRSVDLGDYKQPIVGFFTEDWRMVMLDFSIAEGVLFFNQPIDMYINVRITALDSENRMVDKTKKFSVPLSELDGEEIPPTHI